jgi:hypothetical protein
MSGTSGSEYTSVCSDCRKKGADKPRVPESDETTQSSSGAVIDSKTKVEADNTKREEREQTEEDYYEEREESDIEQKQELNKTEQKSTLEKQHRQTFLDRGFLGAKKTGAASGESRWQVEKTAQQASAAETASNQDNATKEDLREKGLDQNSTEDLRQGLKEKHKGVAFSQGAAFQSFAAQLGKSTTFTQSTPTNPAASQTIAESIEKNWGPGRKK